MTDHEDNFAQTLEELLGLLCDINQDIVDCGLSNLEVEETREMIEFLSVYGNKELVQEFSSHHEKWTHVKNRSDEFILEHMPNIYPELETQIVTEPIRVFNEIGENEAIDQDKIDIIWSYFDALIRHCCRYIRDNKKEEWCSEIDHEQYIDMFEVK